MHCLRALASANPASWAKLNGSLAALAFASSSSQLLWHRSGAWKEVACGFSNHFHGIAYLGYMFEVDSCQTWFPPQLSLPKPTLKWIRNNEGDWMPDRQLVDSIGTSWITLLTLFRIAMQVRVKSDPTFEDTPRRYAGCLKQPSATIDWDL